MLEVEEQRAEAVHAGIRDSVIEHEPAVIGPDRYGVDADLLAVPHAAPWEDYRPMREEFSCPVEVELLVGIDIDGGLDAVEDVVLAVDLLRKQAGVLVIDAGRGDEYRFGEIVEALGEKIVLADGGEGDTRRLGRIDSRVEEIGGIVDDGQAGILTAGIARGGLLLERSTRCVDWIREA